MAKPHSTFYFDETPVVLQVENTLFKVHKYHLLQSETFSDMFKAPSTPRESDEGVTPEHPIVLNGVAASDFEALLTVLYERRCSNTQQQLTSSLITSAFRLANMWNFVDLRAYLLARAEESLDDVEKIDFAKKFGIEKWLKPAYLNLCRRSSPPSTEEAIRLGVHDLLMIFRLREQFRPWDPTGGCGSDSDGSEKFCSRCAGYSYYTSSTPNSGGFGGFGTSPASANRHNCSKCGKEIQSYFKRNQPSESSNPVGSLESQLEEWIKRGCEPK